MTSSPQMKDSINVNKRISPYVTNAQWQITFSTYINAPQTKNQLSGWPLKWKKRTQPQPNPFKKHHCPQFQTRTRNWNKEKDQSPNPTCITLQLCPMEIERGRTPTKWILHCQNKIPTEFVNMYARVQMFYLPTNLFPYKSKIKTRTCTLTRTNTHTHTRTR